MLLIVCTVSDGNNLLFQYTHRAVFVYYNAITTYISCGNIIYVTDGANKKIPSADAWPHDHIHHN